VKSDHQDSITAFLDDSGLSRHWSRLILPGFWS
jgi:hypothetical protein